MDEPADLFGSTPASRRDSPSGSVHVDRKVARATLWEEAAKAAAGHIYEQWSKPIERLSAIADEGSRTHIAFLGTAILAKCVAPDVDVFAVKLESGHGAYSARGLCHNVLVPNAPELDISLGVTGREPLNNQPYFRINRVSRDIPIRSTARPVLNLLCDILDRLQEASQDEARQALRAFIQVRRKFGRRFSRTVDISAGISAEDLVLGVERLVSDASEGGRRAQAVVAALMDVFAGKARVDSRRINDPSRTVPGDVNVRRHSGVGWERVFEVRDKPVSREDLYLFVGKCVEEDVDEAVIFAIASPGAPQQVAEAQAWSAGRGVALTLYTSWRELITQALHWASESSLKAVRELPALIEDRLIQLEVSESGLELWQSFVAEHSFPFNPES